MFLYMLQTTSISGFDSNLAVGYLQYYGTVATRVNSVEVNAVIIKQWIYFRCKVKRNEILELYC